MTAPAAAAGRFAAACLLGMGLGLLLCEEKDLLLGTYGIVHCSAAELDALDPAAVLGRKVNAYGAQAIVRRDAVPAGLTLSPVSIEELFLFMVKEGK